MKMYNYGFIGSGNMGGALLKAVCKKTNGNDTAVYDKDFKKAENAAAENGCQAVNCETVVKNSKFLFLGVKPQVLPFLMSEISPILKQNKNCVLVTMAAGVSIERLTEMCGFDCPIIRIMPNTPVSIGKGMILYTVNKYVADDIKTEFIDALEFAGDLDEIPENLIDAASCISGCGPAFVYMFTDALADGGVNAGLPRDKALKYAVKTVLGSAGLIESSDRHPEKLKNDVCSPAGSTIEGVKHLEDKAFRSSVMGAVMKSFDRTKELGKK